MDYSNFDEIENLIRKMKRELEEEKAKNKALQDENEPKRAKVSFAIRPSRYIALVEKRNAYAREHGICVRCHKSFRPDGHKLCPHCRRKMNDILQNVRERR